MSFWAWFISFCWMSSRMFSLSFKESHLNHTYIQITHLKLTVEEATVNNLCKKHKIMRLQLWVFEGNTFYTCECLKLFNKKDPVRMKVSSCHYYWALLVSFILCVFLEENTIPQSLEKIMMVKIFAFKSLNLYLSPFIQSFWFL